MHRDQERMAEAAKLAHLLKVMDRFPTAVAWLC